jgi:RNA polymerase sigma-70 factor (ECF subfamily)
LVFGSSDKTDSELAVSASHGNEEAFRELLARYRSKVIGICVKMLGDSAEIEDAAQDTFVKVFNHLRKYDPERSFAAWLASICVNECRDRIRKKTRFKKTFSELSDEHLAVAKAPNGGNIEFREKLANVEKGINQLPDNLREVLIMKVYGELSYEEIAESLEIKVGTVMSRLHRAREKLTELIKPD